MTGETLSPLATLAVFGLPTLTAICLVAWSARGTRVKRKR